MDCEFGDLADSLVRDQIIMGIKDKALKERMLAIDLGRAIETSKEQSHYPSAKVCHKCGFKHPYGKCFANDNICKLCSKPNHYAKMCRNKVDMLERGVEEDQIWLQYLTMNSITGLEWTQTISVENNSVNFKLDTGARVNILPVDTIKIGKINPAYIQLGLRFIHIQEKKYQ
ncbi:hypothetical protein LAZ67_22000675 [Cordylochernes scorpioides]|uniref:Peptidase A2 domain-containing protein n=1 Tax=Cordylochernes scorpioides TaxID=51811 RepID=A0ABY6LND9_9ARAC|nr:hypothetical protein LAZ67_22000675 [Cordylochernes scorpioides]